MEPRDYLLALRKSWIVIIVLVIAGGAIAYGYGHSKANVYQSTSSVFVSATQGSTTDQLSQGSTYTHNVVASYATLATTPAVLSPVISELGLSTTPAKLARRVSASIPLDTLFVQITATDGSPRQAAAIANAVAQSLRTVATSLSPSTLANTPSITMSIVAPAQVPTGAKAPNRHLIDITGLVLGLVAGILFAIGRLLFDTRLRSDRDVETSVGAPVVGTVRRRRGTDASGIALVAAPGSSVAEDYRRIRTTLQHALVSDSTSSLLVTSPQSGAASHELALNVALAAAERGTSVLVVDADLRQASLSTLSGVTGHGLSDVLDGTVDIETATQAWSGGVDVLSAGTPLSNPHFALGSPALSALLAKATAAYDFVVVDAPPVLTYSDALTLVPLTDAVLVVATAGKTTRAQLNRTLDSLDGVDANTIGIALSGVTVRREAELPVALAAQPAAAAATPASVTTEAPGVSASKSTAPDASAPVDVEAGRVKSVPVKKSAPGARSGR